MRKEIKYLIVLLAGVLIGYCSALLNIEGLGSTTTYYIYDEGGLK